MRWVVKDVSPASISLQIKDFLSILVLSEETRNTKGGRCYVQCVAVLIISIFSGQTLSGSHIDALVCVRQLAAMGIEVYFVNDNIWTLDGDGELRLTIMATMAQEESRKISERSLAGQRVSREKGVL